MRAKHKELDQGDYFDLEKGARRYRASVSGKRLSGRPPSERSTSTKAQSQEGNPSNPSLSSLISEASDPSTSRHSHENLVKHVSAWLKGEKTRRSARKAKRKAAKEKKHAPLEKDGTVSTEVPDSSAERRHSSSESSDGSVALEQLADILGRTMSLKSSDGTSRSHRFSHHRKLSSIMKRHSAVSSGEDYFESIDQLVPSCEATLDNTKTLAYGAGGPESESTVDLTGTGGSKNAKKEKEAWVTFKYEIVRLAHTLKLKGWRRVPLEQSNEIDVQRLSGALTNAVYVVSPPKHHLTEENGEDCLPTPKNPPPSVY
jgi:choline kinase